MFQVRYLLFVKEYFFVIWFISKKEEAETVKRVIQSEIRVSCNNMKLILQHPIVPYGEPLKRLQIK